MKKIIIITSSVFFLIICLGFWLNTPFKYLIEGKAELKRDKVARSVKVLEEGSSRFPNNKIISFELAKAYLKLEEIDKVNNLVIKKGLIDEYGGNSDFQNFLVNLSKANKKFGNDKHALYFASEYFKKESKNNISKKTIKNYIDLGHIVPQKSTLIWERAYKISVALKEVELQKTLTTLLLPRYLEKAQEFKEVEEYEESITTLNKAEALGKNPEINIERAKIYSFLDRIDLAEADFEEALSTDPKNDDYKIYYAEALQLAAKNTEDLLKRKEYSEKAKLLLSGNSDDPRRTTILKKIINLNAKFKITNATLFLRNVGEYYYPTFAFKIDPVSDFILKNYTIVFFNNKNEKLDSYQAEIENIEELKNLIEVTCRNPVGDDNLIVAKLFINNEFVQEYSTN